MARLPAGIELRNERVENGHVAYDLHVSRWRVALIACRALRRKPNVTKHDEQAWTTPQEFYEQELR